MPITVNKTQQLWIVPVGPVEEKVLDFLKYKLSEKFGINAKITRAESIPYYALNRKRNQYHSTKILERLRLMRLIDVIVLAVIDFDLYVPELNFVFGEAHVQDRVCIISLKRLRKEFYGLPGDEQLFLERTLKEAVHEVGHTYRLGHCRDPKCIMYFSNSIKDTDRKGTDFCTGCAMKIKLKR